MKSTVKKMMQKIIVAIVACSMLLSVCSPVGSVLANDKPAYLIDFSTGATNSFYTLTSAKGGVTSVSVQFEYYMTGGNADDIYIIDISGGSIYDSATNNRFLQPGQHTFSYSGTACCGDGVMAVGMQIDGKSNAKVYIWDVNIVVNGNDSIFKADANQLCNDARPAFTVMKYKDVPIPIPAYCIDFANSSKNVFYTLSNANYTPGEVKVSFDYYLTGGESNKLYMINVMGGKLVDGSTYSEYLKAGEHKFTYTGTDTDGGICVGVQANGTFSGKLYIWNVEITVEGTSIFNTDTQHCQDTPLPTKTNMDYKDIKKAYAIRFKDATENSFYTLTSVKGTGTTNVSISFNYYLKNAEENDVYVIDISGGNFKDATIDNRYLQPGEHSFSYTGTANCGDGTMAVGLQLDGTSEGELYIWDVEIIVNGDENIFKADASQLGQFEKLPTMSAMLYEEIDFTEEPGGNEPGGNEPGGNEPGGNEPTEKPAYLVKFKDATRNAFYTLTSVVGSGANDVSISFNYYLKNADEDDIYVIDISGGNFADSSSQDRYLKPGQNSYSYSGNAFCDDGVMAVGLQMDGTSEAELYIWDVVIKVNGTDIFKADAKQLDDKKEKIPTLTEMLYDDIVFDSGNSGGSGSGSATTPTEKQAYLIDYKGATFNSFYTLTSTVGSGAKNVEIKFNYYLTNSKANSIYVINIAGGHIQDATTKSQYLTEGKHSFSYEGAVTHPGGVMSVGLQVASTSEAKLYLWDVSVTVDGKEIFVEDAKQLYTSGTAPKMTKMKYKDIKFTSGSGSASSGGSSTNAKKDGKYMLLQKNYFHVEGKGVLQYQEFMQFVGANLNGSEIKGNTEYVLSFDYYGDPGDVGTGVSSAAVMVKTLYTGYNETFNAPNKCILWDEEKQSYQPYILPATGYYHIEVPFKTLEGQTDILVGLQSGWDGDAYYWNFSLVEKNGNGKNLLTNTDFAYSEFKAIAGFISGLSDRKMWGVSEDSVNAKGTYSFVPFVEEYTTLQEGEVLSTGMGESEEDWGDEDTDTPVTDVPENVVEESAGFPWLIASIIAVVVLGGGTVATVLIIKKKKAKVNADVNA